MLSLGNTYNEQDLRDFDERVRKAINQLIELSLLIMGGPAIIGAVYAQELVLFLFGKEWLPAVPVVQVYCCYAVCRILVS